MDPDSFLPSEMLAIDDNAEDMAHLCFPCTDEHLDFLAFECFDETLNLLTEATPQAEIAKEEPPAVLDRAADAPPPNSNARLGRPQQRPSPLQWESQKATIIALYWDNSAKEIVRIMREQHGFYASEKQYTSRLKKWKARKNHTDGDMRRMIHIGQRRKVKEGKETVFFVWNRRVPRGRIVRFKKRKSITTTVNTPDLGPTPDYMNYYTPPRSDSGSISGQESMPQAPSSASRNEVGANIAPTTVNSVGHHTHNRTSNNAAARTQQSKTYNTRKQLNLLAVDLDELLVLRTPVAEADLRRSTERMIRILEADRARETSVDACCLCCGFLSNSTVVWGQSLVIEVTSRQPNLDMTDCRLIAFLGLAIKHNEDMVLHHVVQCCQKQKFAQRIHRHLLCIALDHRRGDLFRQLLLHGLDVDAEGCGSKDLLRQARATLHHFITARIERDTDVESIGEAMGFMYRAGVVDQKLWNDTVLWTALRLGRAGVLRACLRPPTSAVLNIEELMDQAARIREMIQEAGSTQAAAELVVAAAGIVSENGATALHLATSLLLGNEVCRLLDTGTDVNDAMETGETALHILAGVTSMNGDEVAQILLSRGADWAAEDSIGDSALHHTARNPLKCWRERFASMLLQAGADINALNHRGETPCITATLYQDPNVAEGAMQWFLANGAHEHAHDCDGNTAQRHLQQREREREPGILDLLDGLWADEEPWTAEDQEMALRAESLQHQLGLWEM